MSIGDTEEIANQTHRYQWSGLFILRMVSLVCILMASTIYFLNEPPHAFPQNTQFTVEKGSTLRDIGDTLHKNGYIRSKHIFNLFVRSKGELISVQAGQYIFEKPYTTKEIIDILEKETPRPSSTPITFPEGFSVREMEKYINGKIANVETDKAIQYEGFLFPDTYFIGEEETFDELITRMNEEFKKKMLSLQDAVKKSGLSEREVIILASIVEREANDESSMHMVAGILRNRLNQNYPLQVDATFMYTLNKTSAELTIEDLKSNSPYNTYIHTGLPPTPIANPGIKAIRAVLEPTPSDYFYYLTGNDGKFYYARTHEEHVRNKARYLR